jgi:uncharacterized small protein (DUF1192 family)
MRRTLFACAFVLLPVTTLAQDQPAPPTPETKALGAMVMEGAQREAQLRAQVFALQDEIARLKASAKLAENKEAPKP